MNIKDILAMPIDQKFGSVDVVVKTCKKMWQVNENWIHQVVITDKSGDALADVNVGKNIPLRRGWPIHITVGIIQTGVKEVSKDSSKKVYIDQFVLPAGMTEPEEDLNLSLYDKTVRSKVKCWIVSACLQGSGFDVEYDKSKIDKIIDYIIE